ncbi:MAG: hypothetical protein AAFO69_17000, partial [Bacteroidota bacterium]
VAHFIVSANCVAQQNKLYIENTGSVPMWVSVARYSSSFWSGKSFEVVGWIKYEAGEKALFTQSAPGTYAGYFLCFAIKDQNGRFGIPAYMPEEGNAMLDKGEYYGAFVTKDMSMFKYNYTESTKPSSKGSKYIKAPFTWFVYDDDGRSRGVSSYTETIRIKPRSNHKIEVYLTPPKTTYKPPRQSIVSTSKPNTSKPQKVSGNANTALDYEIFLKIHPGIRKAPEVKGCENYRAVRKDVNVIKIEKINDPNPFKGSGLVKYKVLLQERVISNDPFTKEFYYEKPPTYASNGILGVSSPKFGTGSSTITFCLTKKFSRVSMGKILSIYQK